MTQYYTIHSLSGELMVLQFFLWLVVIGYVSFFLISFPSMSSFMSRLAFTCKNQNRKQCWIFSFFQLIGQGAVITKVLSCLLKCKRIAPEYVQPPPHPFPHARPEVWTWCLTKCWIGGLDFKAKLGESVFRKLNKKSFAPYLLHSKMKGLQQDQVIFTPLEHHHFNGKLTLNMSILTKR